ncbi:hypothetical protein PVAP13_3KG486425 [Panicum virgatum]|uniref:Uncharacterized protein n=1 Tax=Panicum virgatum TaxID=38727 RepID=A0A8T0V0M7_PANVG|nr:hypothetical protein PVAP13_3KG486425 [Panicum virgatum]
MSRAIPYPAPVRHCQPPYREAESAPSRGSEIRSASAFRLARSCASDAAGEQRRGERGRARARRARWSMGAGEGPAAASSSSIRGAAASASSSSTRAAARRARAGAGASQRAATPPRPCAPLFPSVRLSPPSSRRGGEERERVGRERMAWTEGGREDGRAPPGPGRRGGWLRARRARWPSTPSRPPATACLPRAAPSQSAARASASASAAAALLELEEAEAYQAGGGRREEGAVREQ